MATIKEAKESLGNVIKICGNCRHMKDFVCMKSGMDTSLSASCSKFEEFFMNKRNTGVYRFKSITKDMVELYEIKNKNYGNSFSKSYDEYGLTMVCIRLEDKLRRLKSLNKQMQDIDNGISQVDTQDESIKDTLIDLANYSVMAIMEIEKGE